MLGYTVVAASAAEQRLSLDRHLTQHGWERAVMEAVSLSVKRLGKAFTRQAQYLAYGMPAHSREPAARRLAQPLSAAQARAVLPLRAERQRQSHSVA